MYLGIDIGGTNIAAGIVSDSGEIIEKASVPTLSYRESDDIVKDIVGLSEKLMADKDIKAIGIGCPGTIDHKNGTVVYSNNIKMKNYPLADKIKKYIDLPVFVENDANCAALGEYAVNGENKAVFALITLGTGVGSGIIINGNIFRGTNGAAVEAGHMTIVHNGKTCTCGRKGCWEMYASVSALIEQTKEAIKAHPESAMAKSSEEEITGRTAFGFAKAGDKTAAEVVSRYAEYVAEGITNVENIFQPDIIAVGGGISKEGDYLLEPVKEFVRKNGYNKYMEKSKIVTASLFNDAGIIGAAENAKNSLL